MLLLFEWLLVFQSNLGTASNSVLEQVAQFLASIDIMWDFFPLFSNNALRWSLKRNLLNNWEPLLFSNSQNVFHKFGSNVLWSTWLHGILEIHFHNFQNKNHSELNFSWKFTQIRYIQLKNQSNSIFSWRDFSN